MAHTSLVPIDSNLIDLLFDDFSTSWPPESPLLEESVARVGLVQPPLVVRRDGRTVVACGIRRVRAAARVGLDRIDCRLIEEGEISGAALFLLNLEDNLALRDPGLLERARAVRLAAAMTPADREELTVRFGKRLGLPRTTREKDRLLALDALPEPVKEFIHTRRFPPRLAFQLAELGAGDALSLVVLARKYGLSTGATGECALLLREIMIRDGRTLDDVAHQAAAGIDPDQAAGARARDRFLEQVREIRFPVWKSREREVKACLDRINGDDGVSVSAPPYLEGDRFRAELVFSSCSELSERARALLRFAESREAAAAVELVRGS